MAMVQPVSVASDRVIATLVAGLTLEFGSSAAEALADRFLAAEECDFHWDVRREARWLGAWTSEIEDDFELDRIAILGRLGRRWFVAVCIVDGDEMPHGMMGRRTFGSRKAALTAFISCH